MQQEPHRSILIHYGELGLKGKNQPQFRRQLRLNLQRRLRALGIHWPVKERRGYFAVAVPDDSTQPLAPVLQALREVFGVAWLASTERLPRPTRTTDDHESALVEIERRLVELANARYEPGKTFCVRLKRVDKSLPSTTPQLEARFGAAILAGGKWNKVSIHHPDVTFHLELRPGATHFFSDKLKAPGGLPVGTAGRVLTLLSGGIDSPVAAWLMAKRGCTVDFIHFTATSMQQDEALQYKIWRLAQRLGDFTLQSRLYLVPYTYFDVALFGHRVEHDLVLFRRFMVRVAQQLAQRLDAQALVTGDNLSQVASQTLENLVATTRATDMPIFRPLIGHNKEEIIEVARQIGTYDLSIEPYKDCCALITQSPKTTSDHEKLATVER